MSRPYQPLTREQMAWRAAQDLPEGAYVNLGIGIPTLTASFVPAGREVIFHSENGIVGLGPKPEPGFEDPNLIDAGKGLTTLEVAPTVDRGLPPFALREEARDGGRAGGGVR